MGQRSVYWPEIVVLMGGTPGVRELNSGQDGGWPMTLLDGVAHKLGLVKLT